MLTFGFFIADTPFQHVVIEKSYAFSGICLGYHLLFGDLRFAVQSVCQNNISTFAGFRTACRLKSSCTSKPDSELSAVQLKMQPQKIKSLCDFMKRDSVAHMAKCLEVASNLRLGSRARRRPIEKAQPAAHSGG
jgi:hypothetical protein